MDCVDNGSVFNNVPSTSNTIPEMGIVGIFVEMDTDCMRHDDDDGGKQVPSLLCTSLIIIIIIIKVSAWGVGRYWW